MRTLGSLLNLAAVLDSFFTQSATELDGLRHIGRPRARLLQRLVALAIGFTGALALWWCYFERTEQIGAEAAEAADDAGGVSWAGTWTLTGLVLAVIGIAVGNELAIAHPGNDTALGFSPPDLRRRRGVPERPDLLPTPGARWGTAARAFGLAALAILAAATAPLR